MRVDGVPLDTEPIPGSIHALMVSGMGRSVNTNLEMSLTVHGKVEAAARSSLTAGRAAYSGLEPRHFLNLFRQLERAPSCIPRNLLLVFGNGK